MDTYLDDLIHFLVLPLVGLDRVVSTTRDHVVVSGVGTPIVVWRGVEIWGAVGAAVPLVVGAGRIRLGVAGGRGCPW